MNGTLNISQVPESQTGDGPLKLYGLKPSPTNQDDIITGPIFQGGHPANRQLPAVPRPDIKQKRPCQQGLRRQQGSDQ